MTRLRALLLLSVVLLLAVLTACQPADKPSTRGLKVVATTSIVADVVQQIGGKHFTVSMLLPIGTDPHEFSPSPQDVAMVADADVIFANGAGLETFLQPLINNAGANARVNSVSDGIQLMEAPAGEIEPNQANQGDPHTWVDPNNVIIWVQNIEKTLSALDPANASDYQANASQYTDQLRQLDAWIVDQVASIPAENRTLVTDHLVYGYFDKRYGFQQIGAIIPGFSTVASPSAQELAAIESAITANKVKAVFVSEYSNPALAQRVTEDTGVALVKMYPEALSAASGPAATYLDMIRFNVSAIVTALK